MSAGETLPCGYFDIAGGYSYAPLRTGIVLRNPAGRDIYIQPGDDETAMRNNIEALDEVPENRRGTIADMCFGDYFYEL